LNEKVFALQRQARVPPSQDSGKRLTEDEFLAAIRTLAAVH